MFLVDDDPKVLRALTRLLNAGGFRAHAFQTSEAFLEEHDPAMPGCLVLDLAMPGLNGLDLQRRLTSAGDERPVIFLSGRGDIPTSVRAMKAGAIDFLTKPVDSKALFTAIRNAIAMDRLARDAQAELAAIRQRFATLTPREREVLAGVVAGRLNKQIAAQLGTVEKTIKVHRARVMEKMAARSLVELVHLAERLELARAPAADAPGPS